MPDHRNKPKPSKQDALLEDQIKKLELRIEALENEVRDLREQFIKNMVRATHGASQPPPPVIMMPSTTGEARSDQVPPKRSGR